MLEDVRAPRVVEHVGLDHRSKGVFRVAVLEVVDAGVGRGMGVLQQGGFEIGRGSGREEHEMRGAGLRMR